MTKPRLLQCRVDALTIAFKVPLPNRVMAGLSSACDRSPTGEGVWSVGGSRFGMKRAGRRGASFHLHNGDADIMVGFDQHGWNVRVELRAIFLATHELSTSIDAARTLAKDIGVGPVADERVRRLDLCADATGAAFDACDRAGFVGRTRSAVEYHPTQLFSRRRKNGPTCTGFTFSKGNPLMARLYNKTEELRSQHAPNSEKALTETAHWRKNSWDGASDVWRLEVQLRSKPLEELGARDPRSLGERLDPIWRYTFGELGAAKPKAWLRLIDVASATRTERCAIDPRWEAFQQADFRSSQRAPAERARGLTRGVPLEQAVGAVLSFLAARAALPDLEHHRSAHELLSAVGRCFVDEVDGTPAGATCGDRLRLAEARNAGLCENRIARLSSSR